MKFRKTIIEDIKNVMQIIDDAKEYFRKRGGLLKWEKK